MGDNRTEFREALGEIVEATSPAPTDHPSHERWLAYQRGELPAEEEARLQEHLVRCRDCCDLVQAADALFGPEPEPEAGEADDPIAKAAVWHLLQPQLEGERQAPLTRPRRARFRFRLPTTIAASLLLALLGMTGWNLEQRREILALRAPRPDVPIYDFSSGERASGPEEATTLTVKSGPAVLVFYPGEERPAYRLVVRDAGTRRAISSHTLHQNTIGALTCELPAGLPPGRYQLEIAEPAGKVLATYRLRVVAAGQGG